MSMNDDALHITCCFLGLDLHQFDEWLQSLPDDEFKQHMVRSRARVIELIEEWDGPTQIDLEDEQSQELVKQRILELKQHWRADKRDKVVMPLVRKEKSRVANLRTGQEQYARWRELADEIRKEKPYLTKKTDIARLVHRRLSNSHDPRDHEFKQNIDTIRKKI